MNVPVIGFLKMKSSPFLPPLGPGSVLWINATARQSLAPRGVSRWEVPCVQDIQCQLIAPTLLGVTGNIILSCVFVFLTILLMISIKICHTIAARNDKKKVGSTHISHMSLISLVKSEIICLEKELS